MSDLLKKQQLFKYKTFATGLFVLMTFLFVTTTFLQKENSAIWIGYLRAFSEAAMVGALADWFAVTALFHHPLGLKIPHTNLIEKSKEKIGDNLGSFVVENFLSPENIRPYILKLKLSVHLKNWLSQEKNQNLLLTELSTILINAICKIDDKFATHFIKQKAEELTKTIRINALLGNGIDYIISKNDHQKLITNLSSQIKNYILENKTIVSEKVKQESFFFIPKSVDNKIAEKITNGLSDYFREVEENKNHPLRKEITQKILAFSKELKTEERWNEEFDAIKTDFLKTDKLNQYSKDIWVSAKSSIIKELSDSDSGLKKHIKRNLNEFVFALENDDALQYKTDHWIRVTAYKYILKNTQAFGSLISSTVGNWKGEELSRKLELEVGKDLQFIRVNGTLVGGLVGLLIYFFAQLIT